MKKVVLISLLLIGTLYCQTPVYLWIDGTANFSTFSYKDSISYYLDKAASIGVTDIIVDVKPISGEVLYRSTIAPIMHAWNRFTRTDEFDYLSYFISEGHARNMQVHAGINVFTEGHILFSRGPVFGQKGSWQNKNHTWKGLKDITELKHLNAAAVNPADEEVQSYELSIIEEIVTHYNLDGIVLDRARYESMEGDFSQKSRRLFKEYIHENVERFPAGIYTWKRNTDSSYSKERGPLFNKWVEWRASVLQSFFTRVHDLVKARKPQMKVGTFNGSWYPNYYEHGVNWGSSNFDASKHYDWATPQYKNYSILNSIDYGLAGCFYYEVDSSDIAGYNKYLDDRHMVKKKKESWESVEGAAKLISMVTLKEKPMLGSLFLFQYKDNPAQLSRAIDVCIKQTSGVMLFDMVYLIKYDWWKLVKDAIKNKK